MERYKAIPAQIKATQWDGTTEDAERIIDHVLEYDGWTATYDCTWVHEGQCSARPQDHNIIVRTSVTSFGLGHGWWLIENESGKHFDKFRAMTNPEFQDRFVLEPQVTAKGYVTDEVYNDLIASNYIQVDEGFVMSYKSYDLATGNGVYCSCGQRKISKNGARLARWAKRHTRKTGHNWKVY